MAKIAAKNRTGSLLTETTRIYEIVCEEKKGLQFCEIMADNLCGSTSKECATCHKKDLLVRKTMAFSPVIFDTTGIG